MKADDPRHGTYAGWNQHKREGKKPCAPCRAAQAAYARERRRRWPKTYARECAMQAARERALWRLAKLQPGLFKALVAEEMSREDGAA